MKLKLDDKEYDTENLSDHAMSVLSLMQFSNKRIQELSNMQAVLQRAKHSYIENLRKEMLSDKAGFMFNQD